jgi:hypothetical protein
MRRFLSWIFAFVLLTAAGCGNKISDGTGDEDGGQTDGGAAGQGGGGASGQGGSGASGQGGSGPPGPPSQTSLFFVVGPPGVPGAGCAISGSYVANIGGPPRASAGDPGPREVDGVDARIGCRVAGGPTFDLSASAEKAAVSFLLISGTVSNGAGTGTISVAGPGTAGTRLASESDACQLNVSRTPYQIAPGNVWASFDCPVVVNASDPGSRCGVRGEFVFENCEE